MKSMRRPMQACTAEFRFGLAVSVVSRSTGASSCAATVIVVDGAYHETLTPFERGGADSGVDCVYRGAGERAGTYTIDAKLDGSEKTLAGIVVTKDACHVVPQVVTIDL
jgi:hypothetical protein